MRTTLSYVTADGKLFGSEIEALKHENSVLSVRLCKAEEKLRTIKALENKTLKIDFANIPESPGIYMYTCLVNGKRYIGSAASLRTRIKRFYDFNRKYAGEKLENARKKYNSPEYWQHTILMVCNKNELETCEETLISVMKTCDENIGYNTMSTCARVITSHDNNNDVKGYPNEKLDRAYATIKKNFPEISNVTLSDFKRHIINMNANYDNRDSRLTAKIKQYFWKNNKGKSAAEYISIVPVRVLSTLKKIIECDENYIPLNVIKQGDDGTYGYFFISKNCTNVQTAAYGFSTKQEALKELLIAKVKIIKKSLTEHRELVDDDTFNLLDNMTFKDAAMLLLKAPKNAKLPEGIQWQNVVTEE